MSYVVHFHEARLSSILSLLSSESSVLSFARRPRPLPRKAVTKIRTICLKIVATDPTAWVTCRGGGKEAKSSSDRLLGFGSSLGSLACSTMSSRDDPLFNHPFSRTRSLGGDASCGDLSLSVTPFRDDPLPATRLSMSRFLAVVCLWRFRRHCASRLVVVARLCAARSPMSSS